jgi:hypothetical protein
MGAAMSVSGVREGKKREAKAYIHHLRVTRNEISKRLSSEKDEQRKRRTIDDPTNSETSVLDSGEALLNRPAALSSGNQVLHGPLGVDGAVVVAALVCEREQCKSAEGIGRN